MLSLESELSNFFRQRRIPHEDNRSSGKKMDFVFPILGANFHLEAKEKRQRINVSAWPRVDISERELFIVDELTIRKMLLRSPNCGMVIRDNLRERYFFCSILDIVLMPRVKANRMMEGYTLKGKWLVNMQNMVLCPTLPDVFKSIEQYMLHRGDAYTMITECYGNYRGEEIPIGGELRTREHRQIDYNGTR